MFLRLNCLYFQPKRKVPTSRRSEVFGGRSGLCSLNRGGEGTYAHSVEWPKISSTLSQWVSPSSGGPTHLLSVWGVEQKQSVATGNSPRQGFLRGASRRAELLFLPRSFLGWYLLAAQDSAEVVPCWSSCLTRYSPLTHLNLATSQTHHCVVIKDRKWLLPSHLPSFSPYFNFKLGFHYFISRNSTPVIGMSGTRIGA